jgi:lysophospholipid hydrolase
MMITSSHNTGSYYNQNIMNMIPMDLFNSIIRKSRDLLQTRISPTRRGSIFVSVEREDEIEFLGFGRLVRRILGRSIGLVLGGGGARGLAHLGIFKAFKEAGLQVDLIGGTSIGAFIGALLAKEGLQNYSKVLMAVENFCKAMSSKWRQALDLTYPATSWFTGHAFNRALWKYFGFTGIEDFSVPFFAVTTDLTRSRLQLHRSGPAWKYVRASMSLSGFLPPVCDARDGTLLVDGGYLANVPIELMLRGTLTELSELTVKNELSDETRDALSASIVLAIDVGRVSDRVPIFYGDSLNGWSVIFKKLIKYFKKSSEINNLPLTLDEIQFRLAYASSAGLLSRSLKRGHVQLANELNKSAFVTVAREKKDIELPEIIYLKPGGVQQFGTLEFKKYKEIIKIGYDYGKKVIEEWRDSGMLAKLLKYQGVKESETVNNEECFETPFVSSNSRCRRSSI